MSREIKFRVWDKKRKRYAKVVQTTNQGWKGYRDKTYITNGAMCFSKWVLSRFIIEQYTGLDDKNGVPIYEGDIIQETILADDTTDGTYRYEVYWNEDTLCRSIKGISDIDYHLHDDLWETNASREVIGNIHEPPKDFRLEHLKRMGASISKGGEE